MKKNTMLYIKTYLMGLALCICIFIRYSDVPESLFHSDISRKKFFIIDNFERKEVSEVKDIKRDHKKGIKLKLNPNMKNITENQSQNLFAPKTKKPVLIVKKKICLQILLTDMGNNPTLLNFALKNLPKNSIIGFIPSFDDKEVIKFYNAASNGFKIALPIPIATPDQKSPETTFSALIQLLERYGGIIDALYLNHYNTDKKAELNVLEEIFDYMDTFDVNVFVSGYRNISTKSMKKNITIPDFELHPEMGKLPIELKFLKTKIESENKQKILLSTYSSFDNIKNISDFLIEIEKNYELTCDQ